VAKGYSSIDNQIIMILAIALFRCRHPKVTASINR